MTVEYRSLEPFLNPVQVRLLLALRDGPKTQRELAKLLHRDVRVIRRHMTKPYRWGLVGFSLLERAWRLRRPWRETLLLLSQIVESHLAGVKSAISDLADAPPIVNLAVPTEDDKADPLAYFHEVRKHGP